MLTLAGLIFDDEAPENHRRVRGAVGWVCAQRCHTADGREKETERNLVETPLYSRKTS